MLRRQLNQPAGAHQPVYRVNGRHAENCVTESCVTTQMSELCAMKNCATESMRQYAYALLLHVGSLQQLFYGFCRLREVF